MSIKAFSFAGFDILTAESWENPASQGKRLGKGVTAIRRLFGVSPNGNKLRQND
jgi:hypothetical protein